jgi:hypothetical protein
MADRCQFRKNDGKRCGANAQPSNRQRRVRAIELTLTPQQLVLVWLRNAQRGTFEEGAQHSPPYRGAIANEVLRTVRNSLKGQPEPLQERAILQARREADSLYLLVGNANTAVLEGRVEREREYIILLACLSAEARANLTKQRVEMLRLLVLMFIKPVIVLDTAIAQLVAERLNGQPVLFRHSSVQLEEQLQMTQELSDHFNFLARAVGTAELNLEELRDSLQSIIDRQISIWVHLARAQSLSLFGTEKEVQAALEQGLLLIKSDCGEASNNVAH